MNWQGIVSFTSILLTLLLTSFLASYACLGRTSRASQAHGQPEAICM